MKADLYYTTELNGKDTEQVFQIKGADMTEIEHKMKVMQHKSGLKVKENRMYFIVQPYDLSSRVDINTIGEEK